MGVVRVPPSAAVGRLLRRRREELGLTQNDVTRRVRELGERLPQATLARIESGKLDPGVRRLHLLLRVYDIPSSVVTDLIELESLPISPPTNKTAKGLSKELRGHLDRGRFAEAVGCMLALRDRPNAPRELRQKAQLALATTARNLGKTAVARHLVEELLCEPLADQDRVSALVIGASVWRAHGSIDMARAMILQAESCLAPDRVEEFAWVHHQKAKIELAAGHPGSALESIDHAIRHYSSRSNSQLNHGRALILKARVVSAQGHAEEAMSLAEEALRLSEAHDLKHIEMHAQLEIARLLRAAGQHGRSIETAHSGLGIAARCQDPNGLFLAHYSLWKSYDAVGDADRAELERKNAAHFALSVNERSPEIHDALRSSSSKKAGAP